METDTQQSGASSMRIKLTFARNKNEYINNISDSLTGPLGEYYKLRLTQYLGINLQDEYWRKEIIRLLKHDYEKALRRQTKGTFNKLKAITQAIDECLKSDDSFKRKYAIKEFEKMGYLQRESLNISDPLFSQFRDDFKIMALSIARAVLRGEELPYGSL